MNELGAPMSSNAGSTKSQLQPHEHDWIIRFEHFYAGNSPRKERIGMAVCRECGRVQVALPNGGRDVVWIEPEKWVRYE